MRLAKTIIIINFVYLLDAPQKSAERSEALVAVQLHHHPDRNESCIQCTFLDSSISSCVVIIQKAVSYSHNNTTGLPTTIDVHKFDSDLDGQNLMVASGCLRQNLLNLTEHVIVVFAYDAQSRSMVGPAVILQSKRHGSTPNTKGIIVHTVYKLNVILYNNAIQILNPV